MLGDDFFCTVVEAGCTKMDDQTMSRVEGMAHLRRLDLIDCAFTDSGLKHLQQLAELEHLFISQPTSTDVAPGQARVTSAGLVWLANLTNLRELTLWSTQVDDVSSLRNLKKLAKLELLFSQAGVTGLDHLAELPALKELDLTGTATTDEAVKDIASLKKLETLSLGRTSVTDACLHHLAGLDRLRSLELGGTAITDDGLQAIQSLPRLEMLSLSGTKITDEGLRHVAKIKTLRSLVLSGTRVSPRAPAYLGELDSLEELDISFTDLDDYSLRFFFIAAEKGRMKSLRRLCLDHTSVTDLGMRDIASLEQLRELNVASTRVTGAGVKILRGILPGCQVVGVAGSAGATGRSPSPGELDKPALPLRLKPVAAQAIEPGKTLSLTLLPDDAREWNGRLRFSLDAGAPNGAAIDPKTGRFTWTPSEDQKLGKYNVGVWAEGPEGQAAPACFSITVRKSDPTASVVAPVVPKGQIVVSLGHGVTMEMVLIPAGEFMMGSPESDGIAASNAKPQHRVRITKAFYLGKYEVTQEQWEALMGSNRSCFKGPKNPVERVKWDDCQEFVRKLNEKAGDTGGLFRLPTEAEWEYACRAGSTTPWYFGDDESSLAEYAWYDSNSVETTRPVGQKKPNAWGLYDMHGNVWEWCADWYNREYYKESPMEDPTGPASGESRVNRGGGWRDGNGAKYCRAAFRGTTAPGYWGDDLGFRVALIPAEPVQAPNPTGEARSTVNREPCP
jgi:formylglycine-generating enzyme required for sulfatase activity/Leucine-rich repeat (LRR) protein